MACNRADPGTTIHAQFLPLKRPNVNGDFMFFVGVAKVWVCERDELG